MRGPRGNGTTCRRVAVVAGVVLAALAGAVPGAVAAPVVTTAAQPFFLTPHTALVGGTIDPAGTDTTPILTWGAGTSLGNPPLPADPLSGEGPQPVERQLLGLQPGVKYSYELVGQQGATQFPGGRKEFTTPAAPVVTTAAPSSVGWGTAVVGGTIDPKDGDTEWAVDYGPSDQPDYPSRDGTAILPAGTPAGPVSVRLTGLDPATEYRYRLVVLENGAVEWTGDPVTFTTRAADAPTDIARAMAVDPAQVVGATWQSRPPSLVTGALLGAPLSGFPLDGGDFAALTTGTGDDLDAADQGPLASSDAGGGPIDDRGPGAQDVSVLQVGLQAPPGANCLSFAFRFLSEEFPDPANPFNDAFIAELDQSTWTAAAAAITAPRNFALGPGGRVVSVNGLGAAATTSAGGAGTRFDNGTAILRASTPITPGPHTLYLSLFDQGDGIVDSAVLIDRLQFTFTPAGACQGAVVDDSTPILAGSPSSGIGAALTAPGGGVSAAGAASAPPPILGKQVVGAATAGTVLVTPPGGTPATLRGNRPIPLGSQVDARRGHVRITAASDTGDGRQSGDFYGGVFVITQDRKAPVTTVLRLSENVSLSSCARASAAGRRKKKPGKRFLWGDGKGRFRTTGQYGAATVRGTKWLVQDSCAGTLVKVERGVVEARDFARHRTVSVRAGRSYLARP